MDKALTIQEVAELTGLSAYTLRYYEQAGLMRSVGRASSGHRRYTVKDVNWIHLLIRLRGTGMSIRQMQVFTELHRQDPQPIEEQIALLEAHKQAVEQHIQEWQGHLAVINEKIKHKRQHLQEVQAQAVITTQKTS
jgi:DNA-binding transcriptional MerR regulator